MNNVIGLKGTVNDRLVNWQSMRLLRETLRADKYNNQRCYQKELSLYNYFLGDYVKSNNRHRSQ